MPANPARQCHPHLNRPRDARLKARVTRMFIWSAARMIFRCGPVVPKTPPKYGPGEKEVVWDGTTSCSVQSAIQCQLQHQNKPHLQANCSMPCPKEAICTESRLSTAKGNP